ncbi:MAG: TonB-dependent receptor, partial [Arenicellales bacterium]
VLRGPQSALTGSDALAGVINIITHKGSANPVSRIGVELGQDKTNTLDLLFSGKAGNGHYKFSAEKISSDGFSVAENGTEADGFETQTFSVAGGTTFSNDWQLDAQLSVNNTRTDIDGTDFNTGKLHDTLDDVEVDQNLVSISLLKKGEAFNQTIKFSNSDTSNAFRSASFGASTTENQRTKLSWQGDWQLAPAHGLSVLVEQEKDDYKQIGATASDASNQSQSSTDHALALEYRYDQQDNWFASASVRKDFGDLYDGNASYRLTSAYLTQNGKLHASLGTGVTNPSFIETFGFFPASFVGNKNLKPEESTGLDIGYEHHFSDQNTIFDITFFKADLENEIKTIFNPDFTSTVENLDKSSERSGYELSLSTAIGDNTKITAAYTQTKSEDGSNQAEIRRPEKVASVNVANESIGGRLLSQVNVTYTDEQLDTDFSTFTDVTLEAYTIVDLKLAYQLNEKIKVIARAENAFDKSYQNVVGYTTPGRQLFVGIKIDL